NELTGWDARQPKREDAGNPVTGAKSAAQRKREQRERQKKQAERSQCHEVSRNVTTDKDTDTDIKPSLTQHASVPAEPDQPALESLSLSWQPVHGTLRDYEFRAGMPADILKPDAN